MGHYNIYPKILVDVIEKLLPKVKHIYCMRHMYQNFKKSHLGLALKEKFWFWACTRATTMFAFENAIIGLRELVVKAYQYIHDGPQEQ